jgi:hypothetical protein
MRSFAQAQDDGTDFLCSNEKEIAKHSMWLKNNNKYHIKVTIKKNLQIFLPFALPKALETSSQKGDTF